VNLNEIRKKVLKEEGNYRLLKPILKFLSLAYCAIAGFRNKLYDSGFLSSRTFPMPVICVGNITAGGTGKTPVVESIYETLEELGFSPSIVSKGYKGFAYGPVVAKPNPERFGDEPSVYAMKGYLCVVSKNREKGIEFAFSIGANVVVLDDGFQDRRIKPSLNILVLDALNPFGDGFCLPLGLLREPLQGIERTDAIVITRADLVSSETLKGIQTYLATFRKPIFYAEQKFSHWVDENFEKTEPPKGEVNVFCGIGNPGQFVEMLLRNNLKVKNLFVFNDHHRYTEREIEQLKGFKNLVTTEKDLIKLWNRGVKAKAPVLKTKIAGMKEFIVENLRNVERAEDSVETRLAPAGISPIKRESVSR